MSAPYKTGRGVKESKEKLILVLQEVSAPYKTGRGVKVKGH